MASYRNYLIVEPSFATYGLDEYAYGIQQLAWQFETVHRPILRSLEQVDQGQIGQTVASYLFRKNHA